MELFKTRYENYSVTKCGKIYSHFSNKFLTITVNNSGYGEVRIWDNSKGMTKRVHRLIMETLSPNPDKSFVVDHIDRNKLNNNFNNLRWATLSENALNREQGKGPIFETNQRKLKPEQVDLILTSELSNRALAKQLKVSAKTISSVRNKTRYTKKLRGISKLETAKGRKPWRAAIAHNKKDYVIGYFETWQEAAKAYNQKAIELKGESAILNLNID